MDLYSECFHLALDGKTWSAIQSYYPNFIPNIIARGTIFARFRPEQKSQIVLCLQQYDYIVAMCGDGANDCGALKVIFVNLSQSLAINKIEIICFFFRQHISEYHCHR